MMKSPQTFQKKSLNVFWGVVLALLATCLFSLRWANALPFSGSMPYLDDIDNTGFFGRYIIYAQEEFSYPIGSIYNLAYPFQNSNIARGSIPLAAIPLKLLSRWIPELATHYYFVDLEILSVFLTALTTFAFLRISKVSNFGLLAAGSIITSLSFPLLYRSSYTHQTFLVVFFPFFLLWIYLQTLLLKNPKAIRLSVLALLFPLATLVDGYLMFGLLFMSLVTTGILILSSLINFKLLNKKLLGYQVISFILGLSLTVFVLHIMRSVL